MASTFTSTNQFNERNNTVSGSRYTFHFIDEMCAEENKLIISVEYTMVKITKVLLAQRCKNKQQETMEYYFTVTLYPHIFSFVKYSAWKGFALQVTK